MCRIYGTLLLEFDYRTPNLYLVKQEFTAYVMGYKITVKPGWMTDGASIPKYLRFVGCPFTGQYVEAAIIHDVLYRSEKLDRETCDKVFYEVMRCRKVGSIESRLLYYAVRLGGYFVWKKHQQPFVKMYEKYVELKKLGKDIT